MSKLVLASKSKTRARMLKQAGINVKLIGARINEREIEAEYKSPEQPQDHPNADLAKYLAIAKARAVSQLLGVKENDFVIGADQILTFKNKVLHKPKSVDALRQRWQLLSGEDHYLTSAAVIVQADSRHKDQDVCWFGVQSAKLTMRQPTKAYFDAMINLYGEDLLGSVGGYRIEDSTIQMFEKIEGDYFAILGMPLLPLLKGLRQLGALKG